MNSRSMLRQLVCLLVIAVPASLLRADDTSRGDKLVADYFRADRRQILPRQ